MNLDNAAQLEVDGERVTASGFLLRLWERRLFVGGCIAVCFLTSLVYGYTSSQKYTVSMLIGHTTSFETPGSSGGGGLASSLFLGKQNDPKFSMFQTVIKTEDFARLLDAKYGYVKQMRDSYGVRSVTQLTGFLSKNLIVTTDADSDNTARISMEMADPVFARLLLQRVFIEGNEKVRMQDTQRAEKFANYVEGRFTMQPSKSLQDAMLELLITQEKFLMTTHVNLPYAANLIDGPNVSERPTSPKKALLAAIGIFVGLVLSIGAVLVFDAVNAERFRRGLRPFMLGRRRNHGNFR